MLTSTKSKFDRLLFSALLACGFALPAFCQGGFDMGQWHAEQQRQQAAAGTTATLIGLAICAVASFVIVVAFRKWRKEAATIKTLDAALKAPPQS